MYEKPKNEKDILYILNNLKEEDKHEALVIKGENYVELILKDIMNDNVRTYLGCRKSDDTPVCVGGYNPSGIDGTGIVWLLSTPDIVNRKTSLFRHVIEAFNEIDQKFYLTYNILYSENTFAKSWLSKLGFKFENIFNASLPPDFEMFYRLRPLRGLN